MSPNEIECTRQRIDYARAVAATATTPRDRMLLRALAANVEELLDDVARLTEPEEEDSEEPPRSMREAYEALPDKAWRCIERAHDRALRGALT